ncbi:MAG: hypothetical protein HY270_17700 [Deltaproteobacteria bacterium]|nr:hypothetical protein [Deltaproteobacteria bacterium]
MALLTVASALRADAAAPVSSADQICAPAIDPCVVKNVINVSDGSTLDFGTRTLTIASNGKLDVGVGTMTLLGGSLNVQPLGRLAAHGSPGDGGGRIIVEMTGDVSFAGAVDVSGGGGVLTVNAGGHVTVTSRTGILADGVGSVSLSGASIDIDGPISATGGSVDTGGTIGLVATTHLRIADTIDVSGGQGGSGQISIDSGGDLEMSSNAVLRANATDFGSADSVDLTAGDPDLGNGVGSLLLAGSILMNGGDSPDGGGDGGSLTLNAGSDCQVAAKIDTSSGNGGSGGSITMTCGSDDSALVVISGSLNVSGSGSGAAGGTIQISAGGSVVVTDKLLARSGTDADGGSITISSGSSTQLAGTAALRVGGSGSGSAGSIMINSGAGVRADGTMAADGGDNPEGGGDGGSVEIDANGPCQIFADISATSGSVDASGGSVTIDCGQGAPNPTTVSGQIDAGGGGPDSSGGSISISTSDILTMTGTLLAKGGPNASAGSIDVSAGGDLEVAGTVRTDALSQASAGSISYEAGGALTLSGTSSAVGGSDSNGAGNGGSIAIDAASTCSVNAQLFATSGQPDGRGGTISVTCDRNGDGTSSVMGTIDARGQGVGSGAGSVSILSRNLLILLGKIDVRGGLSGAGNITVAGQGVTVSGGLFANATGGPGGTVDVSGGNGMAQFADVTVVVADADDGNLGGRISLSACSVDMASGARASALGSSGLITIEGVNRIGIGAALSTDSATGSIQLSSRDSLPNLAGAHIAPPPKFTAIDPHAPGCEELRPIPSATPPSPTASMTPSLPNSATPTATATATPTATPKPSPSTTATSVAKPGDANCDGHVDAADIEALAAALFDSNACELADGNVDGRLSAADLSATLARIALGN